LGPSVPDPSGIGGWVRVQTQGRWGLGRVGTQRGWGMGPCPDPKGLGMCLHPMGLGLGFGSFFGRTPGVCGLGPSASGPKGVGFVSDRRGFLCWVSLSTATAHHASIKCAIHS
jgi:hypothetical protein